MPQEPSQQRKAADGGMVIPCTSSTFIRAWLEVMHPLHKLSAREMDVAAAIIMRHYKLKKELPPTKLIDINRALLSREGKELICEEVGITKEHFRIVLLKLRRSGIIDGISINKKYLPEWEPGKPFRWVFIFKNEDR